MKYFSTIISAIDNLTEYTGRSLAWLVLLMALLCTTLVVLRYGFQLGSIAGQELLTYLHACFFMLAFAFALKHGQHVRVDIFYQRFSLRRQAWVNAVGNIVFLLPFCLFIILSAWDRVSHSWMISEVSADAGGLAAVYLLKSLIPLSAFLLFLQALAEALRATLVLATLAENT